jgi:hypothetical protein
MADSHPPADYSNVISEPMLDVKQGRVKWQTDSPRQPTQRWYQNLC